MSTRLSSSRRRTLASGAALVGCSLVSAHAGAANMYFTTMQSASGTMAIGNRSASFSGSGPASYWAQDVTNPGSYSMIAYTHGTSGFDRVGAKMWITAYLTPATGSGSFTLTFSTRVQFEDISYVNSYNDPNVAWDVGGTAVFDGDEFAAGTYTFNFAFSQSGGGPYINAAVWAKFTQAPASGVPLPGAAGLAACGLLGLSRRRRR